MIKNCCVACYDEVSKNIITSAIQSLHINAEINYVKTEGDLIFYLRSNKDFSDKEIAIFFDKYFLGYILKYKLMRIKVLNPKASIVFIERGECPIYFGLRLYCLGLVDDFICNIECNNVMDEALRKTFQRIKYYPDIILDSIRDNVHILGRQSCSEITAREMEFGLYLGQGKTIKEISSLCDMSVGTVGSHISRLHKKIGYKSSTDLAILNKQAMREDSRSGNGSKG